MQDGNEPFPGGDLPESAPEHAPDRTASAVVIPMARPIVAAYTPLPITRKLNPEILLRGLPGRTAWLDVGLLVLLVVAAHVGAEIAATATLYVVCGFAPVWTFLSDPAFGRNATMVMLPARAVAVLGVIAGLVALRRQTRASIGITSRKWAIDGLIGAGAMAASFGLILMWQLGLWLAWPGLKEQMDENALRLIDMIPKMSLGSLFGVACIVGIYEEVLFRGFLMTRLRRATNSWTLAIVISTAIFTALHAGEQTLAALGPITILSLVFSIVTVWRRSIIPAIVGHALFDFAQFVGLYIVMGDLWN